MQDSDGSTVSVLAPGGVVGVLKKPSTPTSPATQLPPGTRRRSSKSVQWGAAAVYHEETAYAEAGSPLPANRIGCSAGGYGASSCAAVNAAASPPASAPPSPAHSLDGSLHGHVQGSWDVSLQDVTLHGVSLGHSPSGIRSHGNSHTGRLNNQSPGHSQDGSVHDFRALRSFSA